MSCSAGPDIAETGLVLALDAADFNSFKGSAATNLLYSISNTYGTQDGTYFKSSYGDVIENIPSLGYKTVRYCNIFNDYPNSGECCPNLLRYGGSLLGQNITVSSSTTYTYQIIYKVKSGYTHPNFMYRYEFGSSGYVIEGGVHSENNRTSLGNDWWFAWGQFTTQSTTTYLWLTGMWYYQYNVYDTIYVAGVSLHQGTNIIPAKFMLTPQENRGTTVATGGGWADLIGRGNNGELINGVKESGDNGGSLSFDGVDDYVTVGSLGSQFTNFTVEIWFKSDSVTNYRNPIDCNWLIENGSYSNLGPRLEQNSAGNLSWVVGSGSDVYSFVTLVPSGLSSIPYHHAVITKTSSTNFNGYYNGNYTSSLSFSGWAGSMLNVNIGRGFSPSGERWFIGKIPSVKIYNRALTAAEISQNFNMLRGRFGI